MCDLDEQRKKWDQEQEEAGKRLKKNVQIAKAGYKVYKELKEVKDMEFNKTTNTLGLVAGISQLLKLFGLDIPTEILDGITGLGVILLGYFTNKTKK